MQLITGETLRWSGELNIGDEVAGVFTVNC
jgi:hypothetical protein